jgi:hypothetical protein
MKLIAHEMSCHKKCNRNAKSDVKVKGTVWIMSKEKQLDDT